MPRKERLDEGLRFRFLTKLAEEANKRGVVCGNVTTKNWISKSVGSSRNSVIEGRISLTYWIHMESARVEWWLWIGKEEDQIEAARMSFDMHIRSNKTEIESSYGGELNWEFPRKSAFAIQQDYDDFLLSDVSRWSYWVEKMVGDMKRLDDATIPYYT